MKNKEELASDCEVSGRLQRWMRLGFAVAFVLAVLTAIRDSSLSSLVYLGSFLGLFGLLVVLVPWIASKKRSRIRPGHFVVLFCSVVLSLVFAEAGIRIFWPFYFVSARDERTLMHRYDENLGWFPKENSHYTFTGSRRINVVHNSRGFRDTEAKDAHKPGIIFLGDSFLWGYDVEAQERFTDKLQARHPELTVYNFGVSGYGTDQEFLLLKQQKIEQLAPACVFLIFCSENDEADNCGNCLHSAYYKPYFTCTSNSLQLHGIPVPRGERAFRADHPILCRSHLASVLAHVYFELTARRIATQNDPTSCIFLAMRDYLAQRRIPLVVGFTSTNTNLQRMLGLAGVPCIDLSTTNRYGGGGQHWTPEGHDIVCERVEKFLTTLRMYER